MKKLTIDELTRLAFVWAEQDRAALVDCWPIDSPERAKAQSEYNQLKAYRLKRWGRTKGDSLAELQRVEIGRARLMGEGLKRAFAAARATQGDPATDCRKCHKPMPPVPTPTGSSAFDRADFVTTGYLCACGHWNNLKRRKKTNP